MYWKRIRLTLIILLALSATMFGWYLLALSRELSATRIIFLDVGQGDAILIEQGENQILIDGGRSGKTLLGKLGRYVPFWDRTIETVIGTHPDSDHVGGFPDLFAKYHVDTLVTTDAVSDSDVWKYLQQTIAEHPPARRLLEEKGMAFSFPLDGRLEVLYPEDGAVVPKETNEGSIAGRFTFGDSSVLMAGDLPREEFSLADVPESEILKLSHHGSKYSSSATFLDQVHPKEVVVSVGVNSYGHPSGDVLQRVIDRGIAIRRTDVSGDLVYACSDDFHGCVFVGK
jgi:competence protein ComEC